MKRLNQFTILILFLALILVGLGGYSESHILESDGTEHLNNYDDFGVINFGLFSDQPKNNNSNPDGTLQSLSHLELTQGGHQNLRNTDISRDFTLDDENNIITIGTINSEDGSTTAYISRINKSGDLVWSKIIEGVYDAVQVILDKDNNIFFAGNVKDGTSFTPTPAALNTTINGFTDTLLIKFDSDGNMLWSTFWGGGDEDLVQDIALDNNQNIIITGVTRSLDFPVTEDAIDQTKDSVRDHAEFFVTKFTKEGGIVFSTYFGNDGAAKVPKLDVDSENNIIVTGESEGTNFPTSIDAHQSISAGNGEIVLFKLNSTGGLVFSTYLGGSSSETPNSISLDSSNNIYLTGRTLSSNFPLLNPIFSSNQGKLDMFLVKFDPNGVLLISTYYGFEDNDVGLSIHVRSNSEIILAGYTSSVNFPTTSNSYQGNLSDGEDAFVLLLNSDFEIQWATYLGGLNEDRGYVVDEDNEENIIVLGRTESDDFPIFGGYKYTFGGLDGFIAKFTLSGQVEWVSRTTIVTDPELDLDDDSLINSLEFTLNTNPLSSDTDNDGMNDGWEYAKGLDPLVDDQNGDPDDDHFTNKQESQILTDPFNPDTDGDNMTDSWEFLNQLNPLDPTDTTNDRDGDGIPALWEFLKELNPVINDGSEDFDKDSLTNFEEWNYTRTYLDGLDPNDPDTDGDRMDDGWEVKHHLNPLDKKDAKYDPDNDFLRNEIEYKYRKYGTDPNNRQELFVFIGFLTFISIIIAYLLFRIRQSNQKAIHEGYSNYLDKRTSKRNGFATADNRQQAINNGFVTKEVFDIIRATGLFSAKEMFDNFRKEIETVESFLNDFDVSVFVDQIQSTPSPVHVTEVQNSHKLDLDKLNQFQNQLISYVALQDVILKLFERSNKELFLDYTEDFLDNIHKTSSELIERIGAKLNTIEKVTSERLEWFAPWSALLKLIQITEPQTPIGISEIMEVIYQSEIHSEELLILLLQENTYIGTYDKENKIYTKGIRAEAYLEQALKELAELEEET